MKTAKSAFRSLRLGVAIPVLMWATGSWALPPPLQTYFIPLPETHTYSTFETINSATTTNIVNVISIAANATNTIIVWDHFEDGYEADIANPTQATTQVWGDNTATNGIPPGFATDKVNAGTVIALRSTATVPHNPATIIYDGQDKFTATKAVAATYAAWPVDPGAVLADAIEVMDTTSWSTNYITPVGTNVAASSEFFQFAGLSIMAGATATVVRVDLNTNGVYELTNTLNAGEAWFISNGVVAGSQVIASKPVQVALLTGDVNSSYESRWFNLTPVRDWCFCGIVPVTTTDASDPLNVFLYNQYTHSITVDVSLVGSSNNFIVPAKSTYRYEVPAGSGPQMLIRGQNPTNPTLFYLAVGIMDASDPGSNNSDHDWGFTVPTLRTLSPQILVGWGPGADTNSPSWSGTENGSPVWVTARSNTTLYVDLDGNPATGPLTDPNGNKYNFSTNVVAFQSIRIFDTNDLDQTGMRVYSLGGTPIAAAWGQDPSSSTPNNPYLDMGTTIPTLASFDGSKTYSAVAGDADGRIEPGETIEYTLTLVNGSFNAVRAITLLDPLPANVTYVPNSTTLNGAPVPDNGIGTPFPLDAPGYTNIPDLVSFSNVVVTFRVVLANPFPTNVSALANTGTFFTADGDLIVEVDTPVVQADLELVKSVNNPAPIVGSNVIFTITVTNRGPNLAEEVVVRDVLPAGLTYVSHSGGAYVPGTGLWTIGNLAVGGTTNLQITATVTGGNAITNVAQVNTAGVHDPDSTPGNENGAPYEDDEDDAVVTPVPRIDLELDKAANTLTPNVGGSVTFTLTVTNRGPSNATGVTVEDVLPAGLAYVSHSGGAYVPGTGIWTIGNLAVGGSTNLQITATVTNSGNLVNTAQVETATQTDADSTPGNSNPAEDDQDSVTLTVPPAIDLELAKSVNDATPDVGQNVIFTLVLTNRGPNNATGVTVADALPAGLSYVSHAGPGTYVATSGVWTIGGPMTPGSTRTLQITATVTASGTRTNFAQVQTANEYDVDSQPGNAPPYTQDDDDFVAITVAPAADLELTKNVDDSTPNVGQSVIFTVVVTNRGPDNATGVTVEDILPAGLAYVSHSGGAYVPGTGIWTIGNLAVGGSTNLQITAAVTNSGNIENIAQVQTADQFDVDSTPGNDVPSEDDQDDADLTVPPAIDLELAKTVNNATPSVGGTIIYTVVLTNKGPNNATGVTVADVLPAGLSYVSHAGPGTYVATSGVWTIGGPMTPGASRTLQITATVTASGTITNFAQVQTAGEYDIDSTPGNAPPYTEDDDALAVITVVPTADLELQKSVNNSTPNLGANVVFTVVVTNRGPDNATGVTVEDVLPAGLAYVSHSGGAYVPGTGIWTIGALNVGSVTTLQITATVTNTGPIENIAQVQTVDQFDTDSTPGNDVPSEDDQDDADLTVPAAGDLELTKTVDDATPNVGDSIVFTVTVTNRGPDAQQTVTVLDALPAGLTYASHAGGLYNPGTGIWSIGNLAANASTSLTITATVAASGTITNFAQVQTALHFDIDSTPGNAPPYAEDDDDFAVVTVPPAADLELRKDVDNGNPNLLDDVTFTITVTNRGPDNATGVTVEDILPVDLTYVSHSGGSYVPGTGIWTIGTLGVGSVTTLQITATVTNTGVITNTAQVETANEFDIDSTPGNGVPAEDDQDNALVSVGAAADLELEKTVDDPAPNVGDSVVYTVTVTNRGPDNATGVAVEDVLPAGLVYVSDDGGGAYNSGTGIWTIGNLNVGSTATLQITADVASAGAFTNIAQVSASDQYDTDSTPGNDDPLEDDQDDAVILTPQADLELTKDVDDSTPNVFDNVTFTITVTNRGPDNATGVTVEDVLPAGLAYVSHAGGAYDTNTSIWTIGNLAAGGTTNLQITATVTNSGIINNIAQVETAIQYDPDSTPGNDNPQEDDQDDATLNVPPASDLELTKDVDDPTPFAGGSVTYTITVTNRGPDEGEGITVEDILPAGVSYTSHANGNYNAGTGIWTIGDLVAGASTALTITVSVDAEGVITNVAQVQTSDHFDPDSTPGNEDGAPYEDDEDDAVIAASAVIDLEVDKIVDKAEANPFENAVWTVTVTNRGPSAATGVTVYDPLPTNWVWVGDTSAGAYDTNTAIWTIGALPAGGSTSLAITAYATLGVTVMGHGPVPPAYTNVAQVWTADQTNDTDSTPGNNVLAEDDQDDAEIPIRALSDLALTKSVDNATPYVGSQIAYTIVVTNEGPQPASGVLIEDVLPAGLTYVSNNVGVAYNPGTGIWDIGLMLSGWSRTLTIWATVDVPGLITNVAQVNNNEHFDIDSTPDNDDPLEDDQDEVVINGQPLVDVELDKIVDKAQADPFENVVWTVTVTNKGPSPATGLTVSDPLPVNWVYVSDSSGAYDTNTSIWTIGTLPAGGSTSLAITAYATLGVTVAGHGPVPPAYTNVAQVWTVNEDDVDSTPGNEDGAPYEDDEDEAQIPIRALSDLALTKTVDDPTPNVGQQIAYTIVLTNEGPQPAVGVLIEDVLPAGLTYVSNSVGAAYNPGTGIWDRGLMLPGWSRTLTIWATVDSPNIITNIAQVNHNEHFDIDSTPDNDDPLEDDQDEVVITPQQADLELDKSGPDYVQAGGTATFTITVTNSGPDAATGVTVEDVLPAGLVYQSHANGAYDSGTGIWTVGTLAVGSSTSLQVTATVTLPGLYTNVAQVETSDQHDPDSTPGNEDDPPYEDDEDDAVVQGVQPAIQIIKTAGGAADGAALYVGPGFEVVYAYEVRNTGDTHLGDVTVTDDILGAVGSITGPLAPGDSTTFYATSAIPASVTNLGSVTANPVDAGGADLPGIADVTDDDDAVVLVAFLSIEKEDSPDPVRPGQALSYTLWVGNPSEHIVQNVVLTETYPAEFGYVSAVPPPSSGNNVWDLGDFNPGELRVIVVNGVVAPGTPDGTILTNRIEVVSNVGTNRTEEPTRVVTNPPPGRAEIRVTKRDLMDPVGPGSNLVYAIRVENHGPDTATNVVVTDTYDPLFTFTGSGPAPSSGNNVWNLGNLAFAAWREIYVTGTVSAAAADGALVTNRVVATADNADPSEDEEVTLVLDDPPPPPEIFKTVSTNFALPSQTLVYTITVVNVSAVVVPSASVVETYDPLFLYGSAAPPPAAGTDNLWELGDLAPGSTTRIVITGTVSAAFATNAVLFNTAELFTDFGSRTVHATTESAKPATFGDRVWDDLDGDGIQDAGEPGIPSVTVRLYDPASNLVATTTTDANGLYAFTNTAPGAYFAQFVRPAGYEFTLRDKGANNSLDSDADPATGRTVPTTLTSGESDLTWDAGFYRPASVGDFVWLDEDWDGAQDAGEAGIQNVKVQLLNSSGTVVRTTTTDLDGLYLFSGLSLGAYTVKVDTSTLAANLAANPTFDPDGTKDHRTTVVLTSGAEVRTADFGYNWAPPGPVTGAIGDRVWVDADADGVQDPGEPGIPNVTIRLFTDGAGDGSYSTLTATTTTAADGSYIFSGLAAGSFSVRVLTGSLPANYTQTGDPDTFGTALPAGTGDHRTTTPVVLAPGDVFVNADFGYWFPTGSSIGDLVYFDANANGAYSAASGDMGIASVTVVLLNSGGKVIASTVTDANGNYLFTGLPAGTYTVWVNDAENVLDGLVQTGDPDGGLDSRSTATVNGINSNLLQDHGYTPDGHGPGLGLIGDFVFLDRNGNGTSSLEEGLQGVTVRLYDGTGAILLATTFTDPDGHYYFGGLAAGSYVVRVATNTLPNGGAGLINTIDPDTANPGDSRSQVTIAAGGINLLQDFGFVPVTPNVIGGTLWKDCDADGIIDSSETPRWAGVQIILRNTASNVVGSTFTDTNGNYRFTGMPNGTYTVDVNDIGNVMNGFWHSLGPNPGADNNSQVDPYTVTVTGGQSNLTGDFGYYLVVAELGDYVWYDINGNGLQDGGEPGLSGVKVTLKINYPNGNQIVMQTKTDSSGRYLFANLLLDERYNESTTGNPVTTGLPRFQISIVTTQRILTADGYEPTRVNAGSGANDSRTHSGIFALLKKCGRPAVYDFGFKGGPLLAVIGDVSAFTRDGQTIVRWETIESWGTAGFYLEREVGGAWVRISPELLPFPIFGVAPIIYEEVDPGAQAGGTYVYRLVELENDGDILYYGPYTLTVDGPGRTYAAWAAAHFTAAELANPAISGPDADPDGDGLTNGQEFLAWTDPKSADSVLQVTGVNKVAGGLELKWHSVAGRRYKIALADNMFGPFLPLQETILATDENGSVLLPVDFQDRQMYFQVILVGE